MKRIIKLLFGSNNETDSESGPSKDEIPVTLSQTSVSPETAPVQAYQISVSPETAPVQPSQTSVSPETAPVQPSQTSVSPETAPVQPSQTSVSPATSSKPTRQAKKRMPTTKEMVMDALRSNKLGKTDSISCEECKLPTGFAMEVVRKLPEPIPKGTELIDINKKIWIIYEVINSGGFGTVYSAADKESPNNFDYAVKIEHEECGVLKAEIDCYLKIADPDKLSDWRKEKELHYLGLSPFYGYGYFMHNSSKYIFLVIKRFGKDLQTLLRENKGTLPLKTVCLVGLSVIDVLEYVHNCGYVHTDIKAPNLVLGHEKGTEDQVYLVDFALAFVYIISGKHVKYQLFAAHSGTPAFVSRDAHASSFPRRSDLEVLAFNIIYWLTGKLLWQDYGVNHGLLQVHKEMWMEDVDNFLRIQFQGEDVPNEISTLLHYIKDLEFEKKPDYDFCREQLKKMLKSAGYSDTDYTLNVNETVKLKKDYLQGVRNTLHLVVIGVFYENINYFDETEDKYDGFLLACYDSDNEEYQSICVLGTGFEDDLEAHTKFLKQHVIKKEKKCYRYNPDLEPDEWFEPVQVWEITCADLYVSPLYTAAVGIVDPKKGISLLFPRLVRIREDKSIEDATSSSQIADMYRNQQQIQNTPSDDGSNKRMRLL